MPCPVLSYRSVLHVTLLPPYPAAAGHEIRITASRSCRITQVVAYDFGIKTNILRRLASFGCRITVVPATYPAADVLKMNPDGVFFSNGPVSPAAVWGQGGARGSEACQQTLLLARRLAACAAARGAVTVACRAF